MKPDRAITAMRERAANIEIERARLSGAMRAIRDMAASTPSAPSPPVRSRS